MGSPELLYPACILALWSLAVVLHTGLARVLAVKAGKAKRDYFVAYQGEQPAWLAVKERHVANLYETPVTFYAVSALGFVTGIGGAFETLCWVYLAARLVHSAIHLGPNIVIARILPFIVSVLVQIALWILLIMHLGQLG